MEVFLLKIKGVVPGSFSDTRHVIELPGGMQIFVFELSFRFLLESDHIPFVAKLKKVERFNNAESAIIKFNNF